ncbi:MAG: ubiquitin-like domain-containing protein [Polyangiaceae bacterium]
MHEKFEIVIVFGVNKRLEVTEHELIGDVKVRAMALFDIPPAEKDKYELKAKDKKLPDAETVHQAKLHSHEKVTLSAAAPYGCA